MSGRSVRVKQFLSALGVRPAVENDAVAAVLLTPSLLRLFRSLSPRDRAHSTAVYARMLQRGVTDQETLIAALLHDVGKVGAGYTLAHRVAIVLLEDRAPGLLRWLGPENVGGWRRPFVAALHHSEWGARLLADAGASESVVQLVAQHHKPGTDARARLLHEADEEG